MRAWVLIIEDPGGISGSVLGFRYGKGGEKKKKEKKKKEKRNEEQSRFKDQAQGRPGACDNPRAANDAIRKSRE